MNLGFELDIFEIAGAHASRTVTGLHGTKLRVAMRQLGTDAVERIPGHPGVSER
jgi:hypothetical protein